MGTGRRFALKTTPGRSFGAKKAKAAAKKKTVADNRYHNHNNNNNRSNCNSSSDGNNSAEQMVTFLFAESTPLFKKDEIQRVT